MFFRKRRLVCRNVHTEQSRRPRKPQFQYRHGGVRLAWLNNSLAQTILNSLCWFTRLMSQLLHIRLPLYSRSRGDGLINSKVRLKGSDFGKVDCVMHSQLILKKSRLRYKFKYKFKRRKLIFGTKQVLFMVHFWRKICQNCRIFFFSASSTRETSYIHMFVGERG